MSDVTFTWEFPHWVVTKEVNGFKNVVTTVHWKLTASDEENSTTVFGHCRIPAPTDQDSFIPRQNITQEQVIEWIKPIIGYDGYVVNLTNMLASMAAPAEIHEPPPFAPATDSE